MTTTIEVGTIATADETAAVVDYLEKEAADEQQRQKVANSLPRILELSEDRLEDIVRGYN